MSKEPECPECERMHQVHPKSQTIGEFLDWLNAEKGVLLASPHEHSDGCYDKDGYCMCDLRSGELTYFNYHSETLLAKFFGIDLNKVETERRALLKYLGEKGI